MSSMILTAVIVLGITGLILAVVLFFISKKFAVEEDPRVVQINEILPGANCGGCGYPGCAAFAENCVKKGSLKGMRCSAASGEVMQQIAEILGDGVICAVGKNEFVISYPSSSICNQVMSKKFKKDSLKLLYDMLDVEYNYLALPDEVWHQKRTEYVNQYNKYRAK